MAGKSNIEWTEHTWNPIVGCSVLTPGCTNCYAMKMAARIEAMYDTFAERETHYADTTRKVNGNAVWTGKLALAPGHILLEPLRRKKPTTYFVNSMGDLFHEAAPDEWIDKVFAVMALAPQHTFQVLTKRAERMRSYSSHRLPNGKGGALSGTASAAFRAWLQMPKLDPASLGCDAPNWPLPNVWLGVSCERQQEADERIPLLLWTPAAVRFVSAEPLLGPIEIWPYVGTLGWQASPGDVRVLDWVIVGGESGPGARPMHPDWARSLRDQCAAAGVPMFFKQWGAWGYFGRDLAFGEARDKISYGPNCEDGWLPYAQYLVGKKAAGRLLDGKEHNAMPSVLPSALAATQNKPAQVQP